MSVVQYAFTPPTDTSLAKATREKASMSTHGFKHPLIRNMYHNVLTLRVKEEDDGMAHSYLVLIFDQMGAVNKTHRSFKLGQHTFYGPVVVCSFRCVYSLDSNDDGDDQPIPIDVEQEDFENLDMIVDKRLG